MLTYFCLTTTSQVPIVISVQIYKCTKDRNVYIKFVRVSNNLYYYARYLLRLWCSRMWHGGMVSRGRWDMRWWWFSLTDILIHIIHVIHTYVHTLRWGGDTPAAPTLFHFFSIHIHIYSYTYICTYTHIYIYTHIRVHTPETMHTQVRGRYPSCTVYILPRHCIRKLLTLKCFEDVLSKGILNKKKYRLQNVCILTSSLNFKSHLGAISRVFGPCG